jgi:hypothetical protein
MLSTRVWIGLVMIPLLALGFLAIKHAAPKPVAVQNTPVGPVRPAVEAVVPQTGDHLKVFGIDSMGDAVAIDVDSVDTDGPVATFLAVFIAPEGDMYKDKELYMIVSKTQINCVEHTVKGISETFIGEHMSVIDVLASPDKQFNQIPPKSVAFQLESMICAQLPAAGTQTI